MLWLILTGLLHAFLAGMCVQDLMTRSKRNHKHTWAFLLLLIPFISVVYYYHTMKRHRKSFHQII